MSRLTRPDAEVAFEIGGDGPEVVTFLHGFTQRGRGWAEVIELLGPGRRWLTLDLRGHGDTVEADGAPVTMDACRADLVALWDDLGIRRSHLVGYSMGARLALHVAVHAGDRLLSLAGVAPHAGLRGADRQLRRDADDLLAARIADEGIDWFAGYWSALPLFAGLSLRGPTYVEEVRLTRLDNRPAGLAASLRDMGLGAMEPLWDGLPAIAVPALLTAGAEDVRASVTAEVAAAIPGARLEIVAESGHCLHMERPGVFARALSHFLEGVDGGHATAP
jgi:2-succinyl-6-hydroxy-2,4-cyclohexadiene-1-carboxylate synthase